MNARRVLAYLALTGAICALAVHLLAVLGYTPFGMQPLLLPLLVAVPAWVALILHVNARSARAGATRANPFDWFAVIPRWGRVLFAIVFIYAGANFVGFFVASRGGSPEQQADGRYILSDHGRFVRVLDAAGVHAFEVWEVRMFSGQILPFLVLPGLYFLFAPRLGDGEPGIMGKDATD